jgi:hypothetical protein
MGRRRFASCRSDVNLATSVRQRPAGRSATTRARRSRGRPDRRPVDAAPERSTPQGARTSPPLGQV